MNDDAIRLRPSPTLSVPALLAAAGERASIRFLEFFVATIRNPNTRRAYSRAVNEFLTWCADHGVASIANVRPVHVGAYVEMLTRELSAPTAKLRLAGIRTDSGGKSTFLGSPGPHSETLGYPPGPRKKV